MIKVGDILEWEGVVKPIRAEVAEQDGDLVCRLDGGKVIPLKDVIHSKSLKIVKK